MVILTELNIGAFMQQHTQSSKQLNINQHLYTLVPDALRQHQAYFENEQRYLELDKQAMASYQPKNTLLNNSLIDEHKDIKRSHVAQQLCQSLIEEFNNDPEGIKDPNVLAVLLPEVFTDELNQQICEYFGSEYHVFWWSIYKVETNSEQDTYFSKWHCDGGPEKHLKVIIYLNDYQEHASDTGFLSKETSDRLKDIGYIFNQIDDRSTDIKPLCEHYGINYQESSYQPASGDCLVFNPNKIAHRAYPPEQGKVRYALNFCLVQSEANWRDVVENYYVAKYDCQSFEGYASKAMKYRKLKTNDDSQILKPVTIGNNHDIENFQHISFLVNGIFKSKALAMYVQNYIVKNDPHLLKCGSIFEFIKQVKALLIGQLDASKALNTEVVEGLHQLSVYEQSFVDSFNRYQVTNKPQANAVFWPNPSHQKYPLSKYDMLPFVKKYPIMDINTPIGSAGSCFAFEIAKYFQQQGFNYVVTERNDNPNSGIFIDGYQPGDKYVKFCANYGILFNSPSFLQLAEKAFGVRDFSKLLYKNDQGYFFDPYREGVMFASEQAYLDDYQNHLKAIRASFLQAKVFVVTLGLNECWQLHDGTFMSRNPRDNMYHLVKHKTLSVAENIEYIQRFFDIIKAHNPDFKLIISVSPIPFLATGRADEHHIISANTHSKSVLRVVADELVTNNPDMYYLPSYELVTECVEDAWDVDHRHVKSSTVEKVVDMFQQIFMKTDAQE